MNPTTLLSLVGRLQYVNGLNGENLCGATGPLSVTRSPSSAPSWRVRRSCSPTVPFRFTVGGQIGGGYVAHAVVFPTDTACGPRRWSNRPSQNTQCVDALLGGPFLIGPTAGFLYELGDVANLVVGLNTELGAPKFTFNFDLDVGLAFRL